MRGRRTGTRTRERGKGLFRKAKNTEIDAGRGRGKRGQDEKAFKGDRKRNAGCQKGRERAGG